VARQARRWAGWVRIRRGYAGLEGGKEVGWVRRRSGEQDWKGDRKWAGYNEGEAGQNGRWEGVFRIGRGHYVRR
jgi:hypothetical protein